MESFNHSSTAGICSCFGGLIFNDKTEEFSRCDVSFKAAGPVIFCVVLGWVVNAHDKSWKMCKLGSWDLSRMWENRGILDTAWCPQLCVFGFSYLALAMQVVRVVTLAVPLVESYYGKFYRSCPAVKSCCWLLFSSLWHSWSCDMELILVPVWLINNYSYTSTLS